MMHAADLPAAGAIVACGIERLTIDRVQGRLRPEPVNDSIIAVCRRHKAVLLELVNTETPLQTFERAELIQQLLARTHEEHRSDAECEERSAKDR